MPYSYNDRPGQGRDKWTNTATPPALYIDIVDGRKMLYPAPHRYKQDTSEREMVTNVGGGMSHIK